MVFAWKKSAKSSQTTKSTALKEHSKNAINQSKQFEFGKKSAVEFLDETKAFYVKSKSVRDHKQILPIRPISASHSFSVRSHSHSHNHNPLPPNCFSYFHLEASPAKSLPSAKINRRSTPVNSDVLQVKLRQLINSETIRNSSADVTKHSAILNSKSGGDEDDSGSSDDDVISPPSEYAAESSLTFQLRTRSRNQPSSASVHKSLPNLNCDTPVNFTATFKDSFDDSSGHFTQPSADGSAGSPSVSMTTTSRAQQTSLCCERSDESELKQSCKHLKPHHQQRHGRDSGSSTQHSDSSLHNKISNICVSSSSVEPKPLYESPHNANSNYGAKSISFIKCDEPHPSKLWNRSGLKNIREKSIPNERIIKGAMQLKNSVMDKSKMMRLAAATATTTTAAATATAAAAVIVVDDNNVNEKVDDWSKPILRSKSDISDRYGHYRNWSTPLFATGCEPGPKPSTYARPLSPRDIHHFFKYLGMGKEMFSEVVGPALGRDSANAVVDRNAKSANAVTATCALQKPFLHEHQTRGTSNNSSEMSSFASSANIRYCDLEDRNFETVSIVERNARIIKWLCNCRKSQIALLNRNASFV